MQGKHREFNLNPNVATHSMPMQKLHDLENALHDQGGHGTGKTGNLAVNFSRQGKHGEFSKFNFLHRENCVIKVATR